MSLRQIPNAICIARILLVPPIVVALVAERYSLALLLIMIAGASDGVDGWLAKHMGWRTRLGSLLDPAADKLLLTSVFLALTYRGLMPVAVTAIVIGRDVVIVAGAAAYQFLFGALRGEPTGISKLNTACQLCFVLAALTHAAYAWPPRISLLLLGALVVFTSITSGSSYVLEWSRRAWKMGHGGV